MAGSEEHVDHAPDGVATNVPFHEIALLKLELEKGAMQIGRRLFNNLHRAVLLELLREQREFCLQIKRRAWPGDGFLQLFPAKGPFQGVCVPAEEPSLEGVDDLVAVVIADK